MSALGAVLQSELHDQELEPARIRRAVRPMCDDARRSGLHAEQLLIVVKSAWASLPEAQTLSVTGRRRDLLTDVIRICIDEFYRTEAIAARHAD